MTRAKISGLVVVTTLLLSPSCNRSVTDAEQGISMIPDCAVVASLRGGDGGGTWFFTVSSSDASELTVRTVAGTKVYRSLIPKAQRKKLLDLASRVSTSTGQVEIGMPVVSGMESRLVVITKSRVLQLDLYDLSNVPVEKHAVGEAMQALQLFHLVRSWFEGTPEAIDLSEIEAKQMKKVSDRLQM